MSFSLQSHKLFKAIPFGKTCQLIKTAQGKDPAPCEGNGDMLVTELLNSAVLAGLTIFSTLATADTGDSFFPALKSGLIVGGLAFFTRLAIKRGIRPAQ